MQIKKKLNSSNKLYIIFFSFVLFIIIIFSTSSNANLFKISDLEISEPFELNFNKEKVIEKGFIEAFHELTSMITTSGDKKKIADTELVIIKGLIDSFTMSNERFINNKYYVNFDVNFNKKNILGFFENKNIFPSIPQKKNLLLIPIIVDVQLDKILLFSNNVFYEKWNKNNERFYLLNYLLPSEDLEDVNLLSQNSKSIEDYDFKEIIKKYDLNDFIITIIYKNNNDLKILSKIQLNQFLKIDNQTYENIELSNEKDLELVLTNLKISYENYWKNINQINTSIKLPLTIAVNAIKHEKIKMLENSLNELDLVSSFEISKINNQNIYFKIIYNGSPNKFLNDMKNKNIIITSQNQIWEVQ
ncbi:MAG: hypothetical protein H8E55_60960 [Pelagibacterales bacterium]|nr:hypothetical protein [Pelagibacterales bacterium]